MYRIGEFSRMSKVTVKALRYYDEMGLLKPEQVDGVTGYRMYTTAQLVPLQRIVALRQAGLSIEVIRDVLSGQDVAEVFRLRRETLRWELAEALGRLSRLESILKQEDYFMKYQAVVRELPGCTVFYKEGMVPSYAGIGAFVVQAGEECAAANPNLKCAEPDYSFITYVDPEYKEKDVGLCYAQAVTARGVETDTIKFKDLQPVQAVCVYHKGPYDSLGEAYAYLMSWIEDNGYVVAERPRERYIDGCWNKENPEDWLTEIQFPIERKA